MTRLIDTHSHLYDEAFDADRAVVLQRCLEAGVDTLLLPAIDPETYDKMSVVEAGKTSSQRLGGDEGTVSTYYMMGLHPTSVKKDWRMQLAEAERRLFAEPRHFVAVGEVGLDFYWDRTFEREQVEALEIQMGWARQLNLPLCLHVRKAYEEMLHLLPKEGLTGVMHCFGGDLRQALRAIERGFYIGVGGVVTFKNAGLAEVVREVPLERIVLETDCPYLAPVPHRGHRNESSYIPLIAQKVAELKGLSLEEVAQQTTLNAKHLFNI